MFSISVYNNKSIISDDEKENGKLDFAYSQALRNHLSYDVKDAEWSELYKRGIWDGKISLFNNKNQSFPTGLTNRVKDLFEILKVECRFIDKREKPNYNFPVQCDFGGKELRDYQLASAQTSKKLQRGMLALCTGAGKTMTSCELFKELGVSPVVFIVPGIELLKQTQREFEKYLRLNGQPIKVGIAGGGLCSIDLNTVNVVTYQTALIAFDKKYLESKNKIVEDKTGGDGNSKPTEKLVSEYEVAKKVYETSLIQAEKLSKNLDEKEKQKYIKEKTKLTLSVLKKSESALSNRKKLIEQKKSVRDLIQKCQAFIVDEAHLASVVIEELGNLAENAYYKLGLSGTPWRTDNQEIRIEGSLGRKIIEVSSSDLIERGFLVKPKIFMVDIKENHEALTYHEIYNSNIVNNWERNYRIKQFAEEFKSKGRPTLILVERREHGHLLESMIQDAVFVPGGDKGEVDPSDEEKNYRRRMLNAVENNEIILIATQWANTGVDAPKISCLILAGSNQSSVTTYQQVGRVLRCVGKDVEESTKNGKSDAVVIDFYVNQKNLKSHSNMRKKVYKRERAWEYYDIK